MILTALKIGHALKTNVLTLASSLSLAEMVLVVRQKLIDRYVFVLSTGLEIHMKNAINVGYLIFGIFLKLVNLILQYFLVPRISSKSSTICHL